MGCQIVLRIAVAPATDRLQMDAAGMAAPFAACILEQSVARNLPPIGGQRIATCCEQQAFKSWAAGIVP
jgi:hypothetical protein